MLKKLFQAMVITFTLYLLMGMQSQATSFSTGLVARSPQIVKVIDAVKALL